MRLYHINNGKISSSEMAMSPFPPITTLTSDHHRPPLPLSLLESPTTTIRDFQKLHAHLITTGLATDPAIATRVLSFVTSHSSTSSSDALLHFSRISNPNSFAYTTTIRCLSRSSSPQTAISFFISMISSSSAQPQKLTFPPLFSAYGRTGEAGDGRQLHGMVVKTGLAENDPFVINSILAMYASYGHVGAAISLFRSRKDRFDVVFWNSMIKAFVNVGFLDDARKLFDEMSNRTVITWSTMISGYVRNARYLDALDLFGKMQNAEVAPNPCVIVSLLGSCGSLGALKQGKWVHDYVIRNEIEMNALVVTSLVGMYCKCGCIEKATEVFNSCKNKPLSLWNSMISGLGMHGRGQEALKLFWKLELSGLCPDNVTLVAVLSACSHSGMVDEATELFGSMENSYGISPGIEHYGCMVDLLGRAGLLKEAEDLIRRMPMSPDAAIWGSLLAACRFHGNVDIGRRSARRITELDGSDSGGYVLLANAFASVGKFGDALETRSEMKERGVERNPGCSLVEVDGIVHEFVVGGRLHIRANEIFSLLDHLDLKQDCSRYERDDFVYLDKYIL